LQERYVGDVGDFGKYGLLSSLCQHDDDPSLSLGVVWYLVSDERWSNDGRFTEYLSASPANRARFRACAPQLYDTLVDIVGTRRCVSLVERSAVLPDGTAFYTPRLSYKGVPPARRLDHRERWVDEALRRVAGRDIVFLDPDNGLDCPSVSKASWQAPKYAFIDEIRRFHGVSDTVVVYHHLSRQALGGAQVIQAIKRLSSYLSCPVWALRYHRGSSRTFLIASRKYERTLRRRCCALLSTGWASHFSAYML